MLSMLLLIMIGLVNVQNENFEKLKKQLASVFRPYRMIIVAVRRLTRRFVEVKVRRLITRHLIMQRLMSI